VLDDADKPIGIWKRKRLEKNCVYDAVYGGRGADPNREAQQRSHGKSRRSLQLSHRVANIATEVFDKTNASSIAMFFPDLIDPSELEPCASDGLFMRET
jgi:hypothetical protein